MSLELAEPQFERLAEERRQFEVSCLGLSGYHAEWQMPDAAGRMAFTKTEWSQMVRCYVFGYDLDEDVQLHLAANQDNRITFFVDGQIDMWTTADRHSFDLRMGNAFLRSSHGDGRFIVEIPRKRHHSLVQLRVNRRFFPDWLRRSQVRCSPRLLDELAVHDGRVAYNARWNVRIETCLRDMVSCGLAGSLRLNYLGAKSVELLSLFTEELAREPRDGADAVDDRMQRAVRHLLDNLDRKTTVAELARRLHWNVSDLQSEFKRRFGLPVHAYLKAARLRHAASLLAETRLSVYAVARQAGWECQSRFGDAFRERYGSSPTAYRSARLRQQEVDAARR